MQLNPIDRSVNWPPAGADAPAAGANAATQPRASRQETTAIQVAVSQPEPSVKIEISSAFDEIVKQEKAAQAKAAANPLAISPAGAASAAGKTVTSEAADAVGGVAKEAEKIALDAGGKPANQTPADAARKVDAGKLPGPDQPSTTSDAPSKDWTEKAKAAEDEPPEPPKEPISKKLLDFLQNLWRASGQAIDVIENTNQVLNKPKATDSPLTYSDPSVKKSGSI